ncbi:MAG: class I tRNA ligase family protein, partial [Leptolyngbyaceae cyanobacterium]
FLKEIEFGRDGDFSEARFVNVLNADLANDLGNLLNRTLKMASRYCGDKIPKISMTAFTDHHPLAERGANLAEQVRQAYEYLAFSEACDAVLSLVRASNKYLDETAPWTLFKQGQQAETEIVLYAVLESVRLSG